MAVMHVFVDDVTAARLAAIARELGRTQTDLAETAIAEAALGHFQGREFDPGRHAAQSVKPKERT